MALYPDLGGKVALVTGGGRGIGRAIAVALAEAGADVAVNYRERADDAEATAARSGSRPARGGGPGRRVRAAVAGDGRGGGQELGPIDILVNNAGVCGARLDELTESRLRPHHRHEPQVGVPVHAGGLPGMRARRWGRIVNISSGAARGAGVVGVHYNASKAGMEGLTRGYAAARQGRHHGERGRALADRDRDDRRTAWTAWPRSRSGGSARPRRSRASC